MIAIAVVKSNEMARYKYYPTRNFTDHLARIKRKDFVGYERIVAVYRPASGNPRWCGWDAEGRVSRSVQEICRLKRLSVNLLLLWTMPQTKQETGWWRLRTLWKDRQVQCDFFRGLSWKLQEETQRIRFLMMNLIVPPEKRRISVILPGMVVTFPTQKHGKKKRPRAAFNSPVLKLGYYVVPTVGEIQKALSGEKSATVWLLEILFWG